MRPGDTRETWPVPGQTRALGAVHSSSAATQGDRIILMILRPWRVAYAMLLPTPSLCRGACRMANHVNASIVKYFQTLEDPRIERTKKHQLLDILVIAV